MRTSTWAWRLRPRCSLPWVFSRRLSCATTRCTAARSCSGPVGSARSSSFSGRAGGSASVRSICARSSSRRSSGSKRRMLVARQAVAARVVLRQLGLRLGAQAELAADALHVDADHARALALAAERGDRQPREVAHARPRRRRAIACGDLPAQRLEVELAPASSCRRRRPRATPSWTAASSAARKKKRSKTRSKMRRSSGDLASVAASASRNAPARSTRPRSAPRTRRAARSCRRRRPRRAAPRRTRGCAPRARGPASRACRRRRGAPRGYGGR